MSDHWQTLKWVQVRSDKSAKRKLYCITSKLRLSVNKKHKSKCKPVQKYREGGETFLWTSLNSCKSLKLWALVSRYQWANAAQIYRICKLRRLKYSLLFLSWLVACFGQERITWRASSIVVAHFLLNKMYISLRKIHLKRLWSIWSSLKILLF